MAPPTRSGVPVWRQIGVAPQPRTTEQTADVVIVGAGPVGLAAALDLGLRGRRVVVLARYDFITAGSKAICFAKPSLEYFDRLGIGDRVVDKGVTWSTGKVFWGVRPEALFEFDLEPIKGQKRPAFVNIQQYYVEEYLIDAISVLPNVEVRWGHAWLDLAQTSTEVVAVAQGPEGPYRVRAPYLLACDGSKSAVRRSLGLDFEGRVFQDHFLIVDAKFKTPWPAERWFTFDPPFLPGMSTLVHRQPDDVCRLDFQLGGDVDKAEVVQPKFYDPLVRALIGDDVEYEPEWVSIYTFECRRMARFVHDRVIFLGDAAHLVSPFGARGCNNGLADAGNLAWKLDRVLRGRSEVALLESYEREQTHVADVNILNSTRSTDFITPKSPAARACRDAVLALAADHAFAQPFVNSGRLANAVPLPDTPLSTPDDADWGGAGLAPGQPMLDAPLATQAGERVWLSDDVGVEPLVVIYDALSPSEFDGGGVLSVGPYGRSADRIDVDGVFAQRYAAQPGSAFLFRPDGYVAARFKQPSLRSLADALHRLDGGRTRSATHA